MTSRQIVSAFQQYQRARLCFAQTVAEMALRTVSIPILGEEGALTLLRPLVEDPCPQVQQCAAIALGRLVQHDKNLARRALDDGFLSLLLRNISQQNKYMKKTVVFALKSLCKHDEEMALTLISQGGLDALVIYIDDFEPMVKLGATWAISALAQQSPQCAQHVVDAGAVPLLVLCLQDPTVAMKMAAASALHEVAKHTEELAQSVVDAGGVPHLVRSLNNPDEKLKKQILTALTAIGKHSGDLTEVVVEAEIFPTVLFHLAHTCPHVRKAAAVFIRDAVKHTLELAQLIVNTGGIGALLEAIRQPMDQAQDKIPSITAIGYIAGHSDVSAMSVITLQGVNELAVLLKEVDDDSTLSVIVWALGQLGKHSPEHARAIALANVFPRILQLYNVAQSSEDLKFKCKTTLKECLQKCLLLAALEPLLYDAPPTILKYILGQYTKVLPNDPKARRLFVTTGGLKKVQEIEAEPGSTLMDYITIVNACFPEELIRYYSPGYPDTLLDQVEQYSPQLMTLLREMHQDGDMQTDVTLNKSTSTSNSDMPVKGQ